MGQKPSFDKKQQQRVLVQLPSKFVQSSFDSSLFICQQTTQKFNKVKFYNLIINLNQYQSYIKHLIFRQKYGNILIQIPFCSKLANKYNNQIYHKFKIYLQYIPITLQQIINIHYLDILPIIYWTIKALQILIQFYPQPFSFTANMIGFTQKGQVKIWINDKFTKAQTKINTQYHSQLLNHKKNQQSLNVNVNVNKQYQQRILLQSLQKIVNKHIDHQSIPQHFNSSTIFNYQNNKQAKLNINQSPKQKSPTLSHLYSPRNTQHKFHSLTSSSSYSNLSSICQSRTIFSENNFLINKIKLPKSFNQTLNWIQSHVHHQQPKKINQQIFSILNLLQSGRKITKQSTILSMKHQIYSKQLSKLIKFNYWNSKKQNSPIQFNYISPLNTLGFLQSPEDLISSQKQQL